METLFRIKLGLLPISVLLSISFFVLIAARKEQKALKNFGYIIAGILWLASTSIFVGSFYRAIKFTAERRYIAGSSMPAMGNMPHGTQGRAQPVTR